MSCGSPHCEEIYSDYCHLKRFAARKATLAEEAENRRKKEMTSFKKEQKKLEKRIQALEKSNKELQESVAVLNKGLEAQEMRNKKLREHVVMLNKGIEAQEADLDIKQERLRYYEAVLTIMAEDMDNDRKDTDKESLKRRALTLLKK